MFAAYTVDSWYPYLMVRNSKMLLEFETQYRAQDNRSLLERLTSLNGLQQLAECHGRWKPDRTLMHLDRKIAMAKVLRSGSRSS